MVTDTPADVLVVHASRNGGTTGIAMVIADQLRRDGLRVEVTSAAEACRLPVGGYRAVVLGSAVYVRRWRREAVRFLRGHAVVLRGSRVWLFQSGPCGPDAARDAEQGIPVPETVRLLAEDIGAAPVTTFGGILDRATARGFLARWMARGELGGDFRDPERVRAWAREISAQVLPLAQAG